VDRGLTGAILAGGKSARMGSDKALLNFGGMSFIERIAGTLAGVADPVVISAGEGGIYSALGLPVVTDVHAGCGALGGVHAVLSQMSTSRALFVPCDLPLVTPGACRRLADADTSNDVVVGRCAGRLHPLFGIYTKKVLPVVVVDFPEPALLFNVNTPEEYNRLLDGDTVPSAEFT